MTGPTTSGPGRSVAIRARQAAVRLGGRTVWSHLDAEVGSGEFVAVLGPNGVGKSTLIKAILGIVPLSTGDITVLGDRPGEQRPRIGYLPQRRSFDVALRVRGIDIVRLGWDGHRWGPPWSRRATRLHAAARIDEVLDLVDATPYAKHPIGELSGGQQQRLLIAQALVRQPRLLLLDEPLDSLDLAAQSSVAALVGRICRDAGVTVMMVAHDVNPILDHLDQVIYLGPGGAVCGSPKAVITSERLSELFGVSIEVLTASDGRLVVVGQPEAPAHHADRHVHPAHLQDAG